MSLFVILMKLLSYFKSHVLISSKFVIVLKLGCFRNAQFFSFDGLKPLIKPNYRKKWLEKCRNPCDLSDKTLQTTAINLQSATESQKLIKWTQHKNESIFFPFKGNEMWICKNIEVTAMKSVAVSVSFPSTAAPQNLWNYF